MGGLMWYLAGIESVFVLVGCIVASQEVTYRRALLALLTFTFWFVAIPLSWAAAALEKNR